MRRRSFPLLLATPLLLGTQLSAPSSHPAPLINLEPEMPTGKPSSLLILPSACLRGQLSPDECCRNHPVGGMARRFTYYEVIRREAPATLTVDAGDWTPSIDILDPANLEIGILQAEAMAKAMKDIHYDAWTPGVNELMLGHDVLDRLVKMMDSPVVAANLRDPGGREIYSAAVVKTVGGVRTAIIGITGPELLEKLGPARAARAAADFRLIDPVLALREAVAGLAGTVDAIVLLAHVHPDSVPALLAQVPGISAVICGHRPGYLPAPAETLGVPVVRLGDRGIYAGPLELRFDGSGHPTGWTGNSLVINADIDADPGMAERIAGTEKALAARSQKIRHEQVPAGVGQPHYLGDEVCGRCHADVRDDWAGGPHALAFESLVKVGRQTDRACLPCHVTAWEEPGGFDAQQLVVPISPLEGTSPSRHPLAGVQCEACHGEGTGHGTRRMTTRVSEETCRSCHDAANDPDFDYAKALAAGLHHR